MKHVRFYEEFSNTRKTKSEGNVFAAFVGNGTHWSGDQLCYEGVGAVFFRPNSAVAGCASSVDRLRQYGKRISEQRARVIHPNLFTYLDMAEDQ